MLGRENRAVTLRPRQGKQPVQFAHEAIQFASSKRWKVVSTLRLWQSGRLRDDCCEQQIGYDQTRMAHFRAACRGRFGAWRTEWATGWLKEMWALIDAAEVGQLK